MSKDDSEREYHVYLFEKILLCCKEMAQRRPQTPGRGLLTQRRPKRASLQLKGRIFIHNISAVVNNSRSGRKLKFRLSFFVTGIDRIGC